MVSAEVESLARTGGLGDVVYALAHELASLGAEILVVTPLYAITRSRLPMVPWNDPIGVRVGWGPSDVRSVRVLELPRVTRPSGGFVRTCLLDDPGLYGRNAIYGDAHGAFGDNDLRFATLSRGALEVSAKVFGEPGDGLGPDVVHGHDWHAALSVIYAKLAMGPAWAKKASVFTLHNIAFQGVFGEDALDRLGIPREVFVPSVGYHEGGLNLVKAATSLADAITTVSPTHAKEMLTFEGGFGLDGHLRAHANKLTGILNGIDDARFDPSIDGEIARPYDFASFVRGRAECKARLTAELGVGAGATEHGPLFGFVSRLSWQKGVDLLLGVVDALVDRGGNVALVGTGDPTLEEAMLEAAARHPGRVSAKVTFDAALAKRVFSGADFLVVPSRFEPCGLTQMYAMRYGSLPIVTPVGGLTDSVEPISTAHGRGMGLVAASPSLHELLAACDDAFVLYGDKMGFRDAIERAMTRDASWTTSARTYESLYRSIVRAEPVLTEAVPVP